MRIAFFGGSFDPPHRGHLAIAKAARDRLGLDTVWMAPAGAQPLKLNGFATGYEDRLSMVELAVTGCNDILASNADAPRNDGKPNFSIDVLASIQAGLGAGDELFFLLGVDAFLSIQQWHRASDLLFACDWIVAGRPRFSIEDLPAALPKGISTVPDEALDTHPDVREWELRDVAGRTSRLYLMPDLHEEISATDIRAAIAGEHSAATVFVPGGTLLHRSEGFIPAAGLAQVRVGACVHARMKDDD